MARRHIIRNSWHGASGVKVSQPSLSQATETHDLGTQRVYIRHGAHRKTCHVESPVRLQGMLPHSTFPSSEYYGRAHDPLIPGIENTWVTEVRVYLLLANRPVPRGKSALLPRGGIMLQSDRSHDRGYAFVRRKPITHYARSYPDQSSQRMLPVLKVFTENPRHSMTS